MNSNVFSFQTARRHRQEHALETVSDSYLLIDEVEKAIEVLELLLELRAENDAVTARDDKVKV